MAGAIGRRRALIGFGLVQVAAVSSYAVLASFDLPRGLYAAVIGLDNLGLTLGRVYPLDVFFAERHRTSSTLRIETTNARFIACPP